MRHSIITPERARHRPITIRPASGTDSVAWPAPPPDAGAYSGYEISRLTGWSFPGHVEVRHHLMP